MKQKLDCMRCIKHDNAVGYIVTADILSGLFIIPLPKAIGASRFQNDLESFEHYLKMRFYSMLLQIAFMACLLLVAINLAAWKKLSWKTSVAVVGGLTLILSGLLVLDLHFHNVLKSALRAYKEHGEIPKMFVKTQNAKARMHPVAQTTRPSIADNALLRNKDILRNFSSNDSSSFETVVPKMPELSMAKPPLAVSKERRSTMSQKPQTKKTKKSKTMQLSRNPATQKGILKNQSQSNDRLGGHEQNQELHQDAFEHNRRHRKNSVENRRVNSESELFYDIEVTQKKGLRRQANSVEREMRTKNKPRNPFGN